MPIASLIGAFTLLVLIIIMRIEKKKAILITQIFLVLAGICYLMYLKHNKIIEILAVGVFLSIYIVTFLTALVRKEKLTEEEIKEKEDALATYLKHRLK